MKGCGVVSVFHHGRLVCAGTGVGDRGQVGVVGVLVELG